MATTKRIVQIIEESRCILIAAHIRLDGDAIGSELALYLALKKSGKKAFVVNDGPMPSLYDFLPGNSKVGVFPENMKHKFDLLIALDCPNLSRLGRVGEALEKDIPVVNIDHHVSNAQFGLINVVDPDASCTGELLYPLIKSLLGDIPQDIAVNLYTAIITDTGRFTHGNTTPRAMRMAAELITGGVKPDYISGHLYHSQTFERLQLQSMAVSTLKFSSDRKIAWISLSKDMFVKTDTSPLDTHELVDIPRSMEGVLVGVLFTEMEEPGIVKASLRSSDAVDVNKIAHKFGGGGHKKAAGCTLKGSMESAQRKVIGEIRRTMAR